MDFNFQDDFDFDAIIEAHNKAAGGLVQRRDQFCWDAGIAILPRPEGMELPTYTVKFSLVAHIKIKRLQDAFPSLEWLGYLVGAVNHETHTIEVNDLVIPKQTVTAVSVYNVEYDWNEGLPIIGVIHSHHRMGAFFSGTDDAYINQNHDVSIVVATAKGREIKSQVRIKVEGGYVINENMAYETAYPAEAMRGFEEDFRFRIGTPTYNYSPITGTGLTGRVVHGSFSGNRFGGYQRENEENYANHYASTGAGRFGSPPRTTQYIPSQGDLYSLPVSGGVDEDDEQLLEGQKSLDEMTEHEMCQELALYYTADEIEEFLENDEVEEELEVIRELVRQGVIVTPSHETVPAEETEWLYGGEEEQLTLDLQAEDTKVSPWEALASEEADVEGVEENSRVDDLIQKYAVH